MRFSSGVFFTSLHLWLHVQNVGDDNPALQRASSALVSFSKIPMASNPLRPVISQHPLHVMSPSFLIA